MFCEPMKSVNATLQYIRTQRETPISLWVMKKCVVKLSPPALPVHCPTRRRRDAPIVQLGPQLGKALKGCVRGV